MRYTLPLTALICFLLGAAAGFEFGTRNAADTLTSLYQRNMVASALGRIQLSSQALLAGDPGEERKRLVRDVRYALIEIGSMAAEDRLACTDHQKNALLQAKRLDLDLSDLQGLDAKLLAKGLSYCGP